MQEYDFRDEYVSWGRVYIIMVVTFVLGVMVGSSLPPEVSSLYARVNPFYLYNQLSQLQWNPYIAVLKPGLRAELWDMKLSILMCGGAGLCGALVALGPASAAGAAKAILFRVFLPRMAQHSPQLAMAGNMVVQMANRGEAGAQVLTTPWGTEFGGANEPVSRGRTKRVLCFDSPEENSPLLSQQIVDPRQMCGSASAHFAPKIPTPAPHTNTVVTRGPQNLVVPFQGHQMLPYSQGGLTDRLFDAHDQRFFLPSPALTS